MRALKRLLPILLVSCCTGFLWAGAQGEATATSAAKPATLTYWCVLHPHPAATVKNYGESPLYQEIARRLPHIKIEFWHTPNETRFEQFNLMIASRDFPDIIEWDWMDEYPGGPEKALHDQVIIRHNEVIEDYAPNLMSYFESRPDILKMVKTDNGNLYSFPWVRGDDLLLVYYGPMLRNDWLKDLGKSVPTTVDEWESVLRAFKERKGADSALTFVGDLRKTRSIRGGILGGGTLSSAFVGAYGIAFDFYVERGRIKFGPIEPAFKEHLALFRKWYAEGLIDPDCAANDRKAYEANMTNGKSGACFGYVGGSLGTLMDLMEKTDPRYELVGTPYPTLKKGQIPEFGQLENPYGGYGGAITTKCTNVQAAAELLDFGYSQEGHLLFNFGIEGQSYTMVNGNPRYTDLILRNSSGLTMAQAMGRYIRANHQGIFVQDRRYIEQYYSRPQQLEAMEIFTKTNMAAHNVPPVSLSPEESQRFAAIINEADTYLTEMYYRFMMGQEPLGNFDKFVNEQKKIGILEAIAILQSALDRYNAR